MSKKLPIKAGDEFDRWTVEGPAPSIGGKSAWTCRCKCGTVRDVVGRSLVKRVSKSCGCWKAEVSSAACIKRCRTHGMTGTRAFRIWSSMIDRCYNEAGDNYPQWGARGIKVCERWRTSFSNFYADMGEPPAGYSIDRENNDGDYEPGNCRWATAKQQQRNRPSFNKILIHEGESLTVAEWAERAGLTYHAFWQRIAKGWSMERAMTQPLEVRKKPRRQPKPVKV